MIASSTSPAHGRDTKLGWEFLREYRYVEGFRRAAEVLGDHVAEHRSDVEALTMPILYCYRHWAELRLKNLWMLGGRMRGEDVDALRTHDLEVLWRNARPIIEEVWPAGDAAELDGLETILLELANIDARGEGFRYPLDTKGEATLPSDLSINLYNVRRVMAKVELLIEGAAEGIEVALQQRADMEAEYRDDY